MKQKKGISLIVLIVTIIVMIIIAGAIIISLTETNIIDQADNATTKWNVSSIKEQLNVQNTIRQSGIEGNYLPKIKNGTLKELGIEDEGWNRKLLIENEKLVYRAENVSDKEKQELEQAGINAGSHICIVSAETKNSKYASKSNVITIDNISNYVDKNIYFLEDITVNGWTTITNKITGVIDGDGHKLNGIDTTFATTNSGTIKNLTLVGECDFGSDGMFLVINEGSLYNCHNEVNITDGTCCAGLVGENNGSIINSSNKGNMNIQEDGAGLVYCNLDKGNIINCFNSGNLEFTATAGTSSYAGGLVCYSSGNITNCYNSGNINGQNMRGLSCLVSQATNKLTSCYNVGIISNNNVDSNSHFTFLDGVFSQAINVYSIRIDGIKANKAEYINDLIDNLDNGTDITSEDKVELLNRLNSSNLSKVWVEDTNNINNGYPILYWQAQ